MGSPGSSESAPAYALPPHLASRLDELSWDMIVDLSVSFGAKIREETPELQHLHQDISMQRMLLMERAREQGERGRVDPALLVDLVNLLSRCEKMAGQYEMDLGEFNQFLNLMIQKVKKHKLVRHEGTGRWAGRGEGGKALRGYSPMDEDELERMKKQSETKRK